MIRNIIEYLQQSAKQYPDKTAYVDESCSITFKELDDRARKAAFLIHE